MWKLLQKHQYIGLGKGPKIKKRESMTILLWLIDLDLLSFKMDCSQETNIEKYVWSQSQNTKIISVTLS